jgi:glycogen debranching enzyme
MATGSSQQISVPDDPVTVVEIGGRYYILATGITADENDRVLKHAQSFAIFDRFGDIKPVGLGEEGLFHAGTRHLSDLRLRIAGERPLLLGSTARHDNSRLAIDLTNPDMELDGDVLRSDTLHISRTKVLWDRACHEKIEVRNFGQRAISLPLAIRFGADYADIFEVRGLKRPARGTMLEPTVEGGEILLAYDGLDDVRRTTRIAFSTPPERLSPTRADYLLELPPSRAVEIELQVSCERGERVARTSFGSALQHATEELRGRFAESARISSSSELFDDWAGRSLADVVMMTSDTPQGPYPYAGVPWFSTVFGRDGIITALQMLWVQPSLAAGVLRFLASTQATEDDPAHDAQPGKIIHEMRHGEMAALGEIPFGRYYGSHDATPLFVVLAEAYHRQTGDVDLIRQIWPNIEAALAWIDGPADLDDDGFIEYARRTPIGLAQQGWKDSNDSVFHADGTLAEGPIALCEIQGYVFAAKRGAATLAKALGDDALSERLAAQAEELRAQFEEAFWVDELGTYGIALDGAKRVCRVRTSNPGHCLWSGIVAPARARRVAEELMSDAMFSGWGIRTLAAGQPRYNPMSYHDGSVWPHDNAIAALGLARAGYPNHAARVMNAIFDASRHFDLARLPELFCGFSRRPGEGPTRYPVACSPQAWAAGSVFMLLQACLGLEADAVTGSVHLDNARLPLFLDQLRIGNLAVGTARLDVQIRRQRHGVGVEVLERRGSVSVVNVK